MESEKHFLPTVWETLLAMFLAGKHHLKTDTEEKKKSHEICNTLGYLALCDQVCPLLQSQTWPAAATEGLQYL